MLESINQQFIRELLRVATRDISANVGSLITAPNQSVLDKIVPAVQNHFGHEAILVVNGDKDEQLRKHRERVDSRQTSILVLLEDDVAGLELPGDYCKTLLVAHPDRLTKHRPVRVFTHIRPTFRRLRIQDFAGIPRHV